MKKSLLYGGHVKFVSLTNGNFAIVDTDDYDHLSKYKWYTSQDGNHFYAYANIRINNKQKKIFMHRYIMNAPKGLVVDHKDGNGLNNRKDNLRVCTPAQNKMNSGPKHNSSSGYKGVSFNKRDKVWQAQIFYNSRSIYLGRFDNEKEAALAYDRKAAELFGEFAYLNFPEKTD